MSEPVVSRRHALGATAALAAVAALPMAGRSRVTGPGAAEAAAAGAANNATTGTAKSTSTRRSPLAGATISAAALGTHTWLQAAQRFDGRIGRPMALTAARMYFKGSTLDSGPGLGMVHALAQARVKAVLSFQPSRALRSSEITRLRESIHQCLATGLRIEAVALWHEPNDVTKNPNPFRSAAEYVRYVRYYGPHVTAMGVPLAYIPLVLRTEGPGIIAYFPGTAAHGRPLVSKLFADYYCHAQYIDGVRLDAVEELARRHGLRLGLGEFGMTNGPYRPSDTQFTRFMDYLTYVFTRQAHPASCMYFVNGHGNMPTAAGYTALRRFYDALR